MKFSFITLFEDIINNYFQYSILGNAIKNNHIKIQTYNLRDFAQNKHKQVDDTVYGGGNGQLLDAITIIESLKPLQNTHIIFLTPSGKNFNQKDAQRLSKKEHITFVCGRYEGFDERAIEIMADEVLSMGDYILTGGELGALSMADSISRYVKGVLSETALEEESFNNNLLEYPSFTKPRTVQNLNIPSILSNGNHKKIKNLREELSKHKSKYHRIDLYTKYKIT